MANLKGGDDVRNKERMSISLDPDVTVRLDALRIVLGTSRAEIIRRCVEEDVLRTQETRNMHRLSRLRQLAEQAGATNWQEYVNRAITQYPQTCPTLEELETGKKAVRL